MQIAKKNTITKPSFSIPTMSEITALPWNGYNVVSTFSGCGGSCLGFKMAGFRVLWASEFVPAAQETYRANHRDTILDTRDIRAVAPEDILKIIGLSVGELDVLEGSPPCASFSTAGQLSDGWGKVRSYSDKTQRVDDLFFEYVRLLRGLQPKCFVAENVSGLVRGVAKGYFLEILSALKGCGYRVKCKVLDAQWLGVPQCRQRTIFIGTREDLPISAEYPTPLSYRYSVGEVLPWIKKIQGANGFDGHAYYGARNRPAATIQCAIQNVEVETGLSESLGREWEKTGMGKASERYFSLKKPALGKPSQTITALGYTAAGVCHPTEKRRFAIAELKRICAFPDDFILTGNYGQQWERLGRAVPPIMMRAVALVIRDKMLGKLGRAHSSVESSTSDSVLTGAV
jgi:DNA (cytosine-5)-methyltransferase 1